MCKICSNYTRNTSELGRRHSLFWWFCCWLWTSKCWLGSFDFFVEILQSGRRRIETQLLFLQKFFTWEGRLGSWSFLFNLSSTEQHYHVKFRKVENTRFVELVVLWEIFSKLDLKILHNSWWCDAAGISIIFLEFLAIFLLNNFIIAFDISNFFFTFCYTFFFF